MRLEKPTWNWPAPPPAGEHAHVLHPDLAPFEVEAHLHRLPGDVRRDAPAHDDPPADERERRAAADLLQREPHLPGDGGQ